MQRRRFLAGLAVLAGATACARPAPRAPEPTPESWPEPDAWKGEAQGIIRDLQGTLSIFDAYNAFRGSDGAQSGPDLPWDPPTSQAWAGATSSLGDLRDRTAALNAKIDRSVAPESRWSERRQLAAAAQQLGNVVDAAREFRQAVDEIPPSAPGIGAAAAGALDRAWSLWTASATDWGLARGETFGCG